MSQHDVPGGGSELTFSPDAEAIDRLRAVVDETRLRLLQQLLASDDGALSVEELAYRNTDLKSGTIDYHLRELEARDVTRRLKADEPRNDLPNTYWAVTESGVDLLKRLGFYEEIAILSEADDALERTDRIREIEDFEARPVPDWY
ncbi:helix-turn-helix domain-containing protein [Halobacteria archaeon AArc-dxtr1]|nr:helix-turn-helix domain-containing protein [Halobacteria archaeon AArc-dxtr1]